MNSDLETQVLEHEQYRESYCGAMEWVTQARQQLHLTGDLGGNRSQIQARIQKLQVSHNNSSTWWAIQATGVRYRPAYRNYRWVGPAVISTLSHLAIMLNYILCYSIYFCRHIPTYIYVQRDSQCIPPAVANISHWCVAYGHFIRRAHIDGDLNSLHLGYECTWTHITQELPLSHSLPLYVVQPSLALKLPSFLPSSNHLGQFPW